MTDDYSLTFYPYYARLSDVEKALYRQILPEIRSGEKNIKSSFSLPSNAVFSVLKAIYRDRPELFWLTGSGSVRTINGAVSEILPGYNRLFSRLASRKQKLEHVADRYLKMAKGMEPHEQERVIHDALVKAISYVHHSEDQTSFAALVDGKAVCAGYTRAFQLLMQRSGVPCYYCSGTAIGSKDKTWSEHAWNIIKLGGDYYNVDITWNDCYDKAPSDTIAYTYYNCTDSQIQKNHKRDPESAFLPACSGTRYSFERIYGIAPELEIIYQDGVTVRTPVTSKQLFCQVVEAELKKPGKRSFVFSFPVKGDFIQKNAKEWLRDLICTAFPGSGWQMSGNFIDYRNGWYKLEYTIKLK